MEKIKETIFLIKKLEVFKFIILEKTVINANRFNFVFNPKKK